MTPLRRWESRIPQFASIGEEAEFWDTHDLSDYWDEFQPVRVRVSPNLTSVHAVRLDADDFEELAGHAQRLGIDPSTLARTWIKERLCAERGKELPHG